MSAYPQANSYQLVSAFARSHATGLPVPRLNASPFRAAVSSALRKLWEAVLGVCRMTTRIAACAGKLVIWPSGKRQPSLKAKQARPDRQKPVLATHAAGLTQRVTRMSSAQILERITRVRTAQQEAEAELAVLVDHAVVLGIGWPEIGTRLGVSRQAARQHYQRCHRDDASRQDRPT